MAVSNSAKDSTTESIWLGLGTNMGDRMLYLRRALLALHEEPELQLRCASLVSETEYVGEGDQEPYLNACVEIESSLEPPQLLAILKAIERREGRPEQGHMLPRPIDLDILLWGDRILSDSGLQVPHKGMRDRAFVLIPLASIAPAITFPDSGETIAQACANIRRKSGPWVRPYECEEWIPGRSRDQMPGPGEAFGLDLNKEDWRAALAVHCR
ncbi:MAG: 2-amino-4-hydroxy-6-hydroxymethyldihydropteridine diphosphokinase [Candidatus Krumholzibacteriia bacterium]|jgi:2-amino-4-hydroxy-6-hydroxymethyldihydropteridine diphosphokinase